ncbi:Lrp/AsnC family transcriptional regulator [Christensenellaceae bacterium OttesenSCG-928-K19]|nr:Lrp/AsnC family transcriptional regulator [Christensenellaceae bacterium OttesenSCG-928-K19]
MKHEQTLEILDILENNAKTTAQEIASMLDLRVEDVQAEIERLEKEKVIVKYTALINRQDVAEAEFSEAMIEVKITPQRDYGYDDLARRIYKYDEVRSVYLMAGAYDLCVRVQSRSMKEISKFVFEKLAVIDGVTSTVTLFIMRKYKQAGVVLVEEERDERLVITP